MQRMSYSILRIGGIISNILSYPLMEKWQHEYDCI